MGFIEKLLALFGKKPNKVEVKRVGNKIAPQVYPSSFNHVPDWVTKNDNAVIIGDCIKHSVCRFTPHIENKKIMSARTGIDGNLEPCYEGIAADCGAVKTFGFTAAKHNGFITPYRYVNLMHIYSCCCGNPHKCTFYSMAIGQGSDIEKIQNEHGRKQT